MADEASGAPSRFSSDLTTTQRTTPRPRVWALVAEPTLRGRTTRAAVGLPNAALPLAALLALLVAARRGSWSGLPALNPKPTETGDVPGFPGDAARGGAGLVGPTGNPILAWHFHAVAPCSSLGRR